MNDPDAFRSETRGAYWSGGLRQEADEPMLDRILDGQPLPPGAPHQMTVLAEMLADLAGPAKAGELAGEAAALSAFSRSVRSASTAPLADRASGRTPRPRWAVRRARLAAAVTIAILGAGGTAAAYAGVLPAPVQQLAHKMIGAPTGQPAAGHRHGESRGLGHHGAQPGEPAADHKAHQASSGRAKGRAEHGQRAHHGKPASKPKKPHPPHPTASPGKKAQAKNATR